MTPKSSLLSSESALLNAFSIHGTVVEELAAAVEREAAEPGALRRFVRRDFIRLDQGLSRMAAIAVGERTRQFALTLRVCLHATAEGQGVDWPGMVSYAEDDSHSTRH